MPIRRPPFKPGTPKIVLVPFRFMNIDRKTGEDFPKEGEEVAEAMMRRLYNARRLTTKEVKVEAEAEKKAPAKKPAAKKAPAKKKAAPKPKVEETPVEESDDSGDSDVPWGG